MALLIQAARYLGAVNAFLLALGRGIGATCLGLMVVIILTQVFFRYIIGNALAWPDEASRFLMLWLTGLMAPTAFRRGGFVSIDMFSALLPRAAAAALSILLLAMTMILLVFAVQIGWAEVSGFGGRFDTSSLKLPTSLDFSTWMKVPRRWMMMSFHVGVSLLLMVNIELLLRAIAGAFGRGNELPEIRGEVSMGAE